MSSKRIPCDQCRQRQIRCDGLQPCACCQRSGLSCRREYVRQRRGPKHGNGKRIEALRTTQLRSSQAHDPTRKEVGDLLSSNDMLRLMKRCVDIYLREMYPIMPLFRPTALREWMNRPLDPNETSMLYALCALVITFMCGRSESIVGGTEWEQYARLFIQKSLSVRSEYDFVEDNTLKTLLTSFFLAVTHFELHNVQHSWFYLREAITFAQALGLHTAEFHEYIGHEDSLYCRRVYNILFVTERSFAVARHKPVLLSSPLLLPGDLLAEADEERSEVDLGFRQLIQVYSQIDVEFLKMWSRQGSVGPFSAWKTPELTPAAECGLISHIQKADILVTQHWLELVFWKAALQQGLLSTQAGSRSRRFSYPEDLTLSLLRVLSSLPAESVEVHGLGIFEKIYDVGNALADFINCSMQLTGCTAPMADKLDRLSAIQRHLSLTPNSNVKFAISLGRRLDEYRLCHGSLIEVLNAFSSADEEGIADDQEME